jgi:hypothetical protein
MNRFPFRDKNREQTFRRKIPAKILMTISLIKTRAMNRGPDSHLLQRALFAIFGAKAAPFSPEHESTEQYMRYHYGLMGST